MYRTEKNGRLPFLSIVLALLISCLFPSLSSAQNSPNLGKTSQLMEAAKSAIADSEYEQANYYFRQIIESNAAIPSEMPYYFAETLYELGQYDNSANFLQKYLQINGHTAENYKQAKELESQLEEPLQAIASCELCDYKGYRYEVCPTCHGSKQIEQECHYCKGHGIVGCSRCKGTGIVTKKNVFDITEYYQCSRCEGHGKLTCPVCEGSLSEISPCRTCSGFGKIKSDQICDHQEHQAHESKTESEEKVIGTESIFNNQ